MPEGRLRALNFCRPGDQAAPKRTLSSVIPTHGQTNCCHISYKEWPAIRKGTTMRLVRVGLIAIALMVPCRLAQADTQTICAAIAGNSANPMAMNVDEWLTRYRESYAACLAQHEAADAAGVPAKDLKETSVAKPGRDKTAAKPVNNKAAVKSAEAKPAVKPRKKTPAETSIIATTLSKPKHQSSIQATPKTTKKIQVLPAEDPANLPVAGSKLIRVPKTNLPDAGAESRTISCSPRFGSFSKAAHASLSMSWQCVRRRNNFNVGG